MGFWKYWMEIKGVVSGHKVRSPLIDMTAEEEAWLIGRMDLLERGECPRSKGELSPYPRQTGGSIGPMSL